MDELKILVVDDENSIREFLHITLTKYGYKVWTAKNGNEAISLFKNESFDVALIDKAMPGMDGIELLKRIKKISSDTIIIIITAYPSTESAVDAIKAGATDYIEKPFKIENLLFRIKDSLEKKRMSRENILLKRQIEERYQYENLIGKSAAMKRVFEIIDKVKDTRLTVLITGETGTGKDIIARTIHYSGIRKDHPFVTVNCGSIPETLIESELFGYRRGAFTGAVISKDGLFKKGHKGTIFFNEIGEIPNSVQVKLLSVIENKTYKPLGGTEDISVDVRIIAATNRNLKEEVEKGRFREDLYFRLNTINISLAPLRERREDIPIFIRHFIDKYSREYGKNIIGIEEEGMKLILKYDFPGNVRELENMIEHFIALTSNDRIPYSIVEEYIRREEERSISIRSPAIPEIEEKGFDLEGFLNGIEKHYIEQALEKTGWNREEAARLLNMSLRSLRYRMEKYNINKR